LRTEAKENIKSLKRDIDKQIEITKQWGNTFFLY